MFFPLYKFLKASLKCYFCLDGPIKCKLCYFKKNLQVAYFGQSTHQPGKNSKFSMIIYFLNIHNSFFSLTVLQSLLPWGNQRFSLWCKRLLPLWKRCCVYKVNHTANHPVPLPVLQQDGSEGMEQGHHRHLSSHTGLPLISGDTLRPMGHIKFGRISPCWADNSSVTENWKSRVSGNLRFRANWDIWSPSSTYFSYKEI